METRHMNIMKLIIHDNQKTCYCEVALKLLTLSFISECKTNPMQMKTKPSFYVFY